MNNKIFKKPKTYEQLKKQLAEYAYYYYVGEIRNLFLFKDYFENISDKELLEDVDLLLNTNPKNRFEIRRTKLKFIQSAKINKSI
jgi:hypothetical protein